MSKTSKTNLQSLFQSAVQSGTLSSASSSLLGGHLGQVVIAGAAGLDAENIVAADVTLITLLVDCSSSISAYGLQKSVRDGQKLLLQSLQQSSQKESILLALWTFNHDQRVQHSYVPLDDAITLTSKNYRPSGTTSLYDTWCNALAANVAYAEMLRASGTPCRSIVVVITDGEDTCSTRSEADCHRLSSDLLASERFTLAFVGVGNEADFRRVAHAMGIPRGCVEVQRQATPQTVRRAFQMVSQSAIRASQGLIQPGQNAGFFS